MRLAMGFISSRMCRLLRLVENPSAPPRSDSATTPRICSTSASVASRSTDSSPMIGLANGDMPEQAAHVDAHAAFERVQVLGVGVPAPRDTRFQRGPRHGLHSDKALQQSVLVAVLHRRQGERAVAHDRRGDAVLRLTRAVRDPRRAGRPGGCGGR